MLLCSQRRAPECAILAPEFGNSEIQSCILLILSENVESWARPIVSEMFELFDYSKQTSLIQI